jgi:hypothetical protein
VTAVQQLWLASVLGAIVFLAAGAMLALALRRGRTPGRDVASVRELEQLRARVETADADAEQLRTTCEELASLLAEQHDGDPSPPKADERLQAAERALAERAAALRTATTELDLLKRRVSEAEVMRADYVRLSTQATETEFLRSEVDRLTGELRTAKSYAIGGVKRLPRIATPAANGGTLSITEALSNAMEQFSDPQMHCIAIADKVGFPVSSVGDNGVELAGYAALLGDAAARAAQFLPLAAPASIEIVDDHGARISVWPFDVADERLMLVSLGVGATDAQRLERMLSEVIGILAPPRESRDNSA